MRCRICACCRQKAKCSSLLLRRTYPGLIGLGTQAAPLICFQLCLLTLRPGVIYESVGLAWWSAGKFFGRASDQLDHKQPPALGLLIASKRVSSICSSLFAAAGKAGSHAYPGSGEKQLLHLKILLGGINAIMPSLRAHAAKEALQAPGQNRLHPAGCKTCESSSGRLLSAELACRCCCSLFITLYSLP